MKPRDRGTIGPCLAQQVEHAVIRDYLRNHAARERICRAHARRAEIDDKIVMSKSRNELARWMLHPHVMKLLFSVRIGR